jgi:hypothetical protein
MALLQEGNSVYGDVWGGITRFVTKTSSKRVEVEKLMLTLTASPATAVAPKLEEPKEEIYQKFLASEDEKETAERFDQLAKYIW